MQIQKEKSNKRDFGDTITPKTTFLMLSGLASAIAQSADLMVVCSPEHFSNFYIVPEIFDAKCRRTSRYKPFDIMLVRDCLILMNDKTPPGANTAVFTNPLDWVHQMIVEHKQNDSEFAATVAKVGPFLAKHGYWVEPYMGGVRIVELPCRAEMVGGAA